LGNPWHNENDPTDVNGDGQVSPLDALLILIHWNRQNGAPPGPHADETSYLDVNNDRAITPIDALLVINNLGQQHHLAQHAAGSASDSHAGATFDASLWVESKWEALASRSGEPEITEEDVKAFLKRGAAASASEDAIIAIVDRGGRILGVRAEQKVLDQFAGNAEGLVFAIDGAVAKARTAAFFSNNEAPLTSRTIRFISQSTVTQREVQSNPNDPDPASPLRGPGFVAPIGVGGHFPPEVAFTPLVDLFAIEHQSRDSMLHPGPDGMKTRTEGGDGVPCTGDDQNQGDDICLPNRFNVSDAHVPSGKELVFPESYGFVSGRMVNAQSRGIGTLPGGIPLYKYRQLVGGIGVFFPGPDGFATHEQNFVHANARGGIPQSERSRNNAPRVLEAEWIAFAAAGGTSCRRNKSVGPLDGVALPAGYDLPFGRIDLVGITLEIFGPHPTRENRVMGLERLFQVGAERGRGSRDSGADQPVTSGGELYLDGMPVPEGWLVNPHGSMVDSITEADVRRIVNQGIEEANKVRAAIRLSAFCDGRPGRRTRMVFAVADTTGEVLGLFRMPDATVFSIDVSVAKARNTAYYADAGALVDADLVNDSRNFKSDPPDPIPSTGDVPAGAALTNRTFRFLAAPRFPTGTERLPPGPFSILRDRGIDPRTAENIGLPLPASAYSGDTATVLAFDAFNASRNFRDPDNIANQNGVVFFPGSMPIYKGGKLVGGFGVSGDGVDQDDVVTSSGQAGFDPPTALRADLFFVRKVRLPYLKFNRNPRG
jgi:uncharacterized protein GlcG (DUF336 family)